MKANAPIGIFDSGVGGMIVAREIRRLLPNEDLIYFGDTQHSPYGKKSTESIIGFSEKITRFLLKHKCKAIVIASNAVAANALENIRFIAKDKALIFDVIFPVVEKVSFDFYQNIGVIASNATIDSHIYKKSIKKLNKHIQVTELATPLLAPVIEEGYNNHIICEAVLKTYLANNKLKNIDSLILGCSHYPLIINDINSYFQNKITLFDSPLIVANHIKHTLEKNKLLNDKENSSYKFYVSDYTQNVEKLAQKFFNESITIELKKI